MRNIFTVNYKVLNAQGQYSSVSQYPKTFDSNSYDNDVAKALRRAKNAYHTAVAAMYAVDDRPMQMVTLEQADGRQILREKDGDFPAEPQPEPETNEEAQE